MKSYPPPSSPKPACPAESLPRGNPASPTPGKFPAARAGNCAPEPSLLGQATAVVGTIVALLAAPAATAAEDPTSAKDDTVIELSPFEVRADDDVGYQAANTTNGSRLNTKLKDTPASISPFTPEFLSDIAATTLSDMLGYATNVEYETEDATNGFNNPEGKLASGNEYPFRMRGMAAGASRDFVDSAIPVDLFNVERAEVASGPNSILFGLGQAGGIVALSTKRANLQRTHTTISNMLGSWQYERATADHNQVLLKKKLSLRLLGMYENSQGWRHWMFTDQRRLGAAIAARPFANTTVHATLESGHLNNSLTVNWNALDNLSAWMAAGRPVADGAAIAGTTRFNQANQRYVFNEVDNTVFNSRGELQSSSLYASQTLASPALSPYAYLSTGPGGKRFQRFDSHSVVIEQRLPRSVSVELAFFHNKNDITAYGSDGQPALYGDPNLNIPTVSFVGTTPNPRQGQLYMENGSNRDHIINKRDVYRMTAAWETDLGKWFGRHRLAGLVEYSSADRWRRWGIQVFADQNDTAIGNAANPEGAQNQVNRRHYVTPGDFTTYYDGDPSIPVPAFSIGTREFHTAYVSRTKANANTQQNIWSYMLAAQSYWFKDRLVTTAGYRLDRIRYQDANEARVSDPNDPRIISQTVVLNEWDFDGTYDYNTYKPTTFTAGAVLHATKRISGFYNYATNKGTPRLDRTILPNGNVPPPTGGESTDFGLMLDLLGDDRYFLRVTHFDTKQIHDAPIIPGGIGVNTAGALGGDNLIRIYDALLAAGKITQADYDSQLVTYNAGTVDVVSSGYEVDLVANPTRNLTLRFGYSHSRRTRANIFSEIFAYYDAKGPQWRELAKDNPTLLATINTELAGVYDELASQIALQSGPLGSRPDKFNVTARYKFTEGRLHGAFVGGALRYQGANIMSYDVATGATTKGNETLFGDAFAGYRFRIPHTGINANVQLNVRNISNSYQVVIGRRNTEGNGIRRIYLNEPRSYRLTTTIDF